MKTCVMFIMGLILSFLSNLGVTIFGTNDFKPADDAVITEMYISYSGMMSNSHYFFSLIAEESRVLFNGEYYTYVDDEIVTHKYEDVPVEPIYMDRLRKLAAEKNLIDSMRKYHKPKVKYKLLDGDMKSTSIVMSDGTHKTAETIFNSEYYEFFISIARAYEEYNLGDSIAIPSDE